MMLVLVEVVKRITSVTTLTAKYSTSSWGAYELAYLQSVNQRRKWSKLFGLCLLVNAPSNHYVGCIMLQKGDCK